MPVDVAFIDTNGWLALLNATDRLHQKADTVWRRLGKGGYRVVVTDWVVAETGNGLARTPARSSFIASVEALLTSPRASLVRIDEGLFRDALEYYANHGDKTWGLIDCASFVVMQAEGITEAFTSDRHFSQAGFRCLLPEAP